MARTPWHPLFAALIEERKPTGFTLRTEVVLGNEPQRADLLLLRRGEAKDDAQVLRGLWPLLSGHTLAEFKSAARPPRAGDLLRLVGYGLQYHVKALRAAPHAEDLTLVMLAPAINRALRSDLARMHWHLEGAADGYSWVPAAPYPTLIVELRTIAERDHDPLLSAFAWHKLERLRRRDVVWLDAHLPDLETLPMTTPEDEAYRKAVHSLMKKAEAVLGRNYLDDKTVEERLVGLDPHERLLGMPDEALRALSEEYVASLPEPVRTQVEARRRGEAQGT